MTIETVFQIIISGTMPLILFILVGMRDSITKIFAVIEQHIRDDAAAHTRLAVVESQVAEMRKKD